MKNKFWFLAKDSIKKKVGTKSFKIINIILLIIIVGVINLDTIVKSFGGDFDKEIKVYVIDEVNIYNKLETEINSTEFSLLESYNAKIEKSDKTLDELKESIKEDKTDDIIINITNDDENILKADIISYEYVDQLLYQSLNSALNKIKVEKAIEESSISENELNQIYKDISINRVLLNEDLQENKELIEMIGGVIIIIFIVPFFILIVLIVQMIGAEINEEKRTKAMEVIISSVPAETHFLSKLVAANVFAITQGLLLILYAVIGIIIRTLTSPTMAIAGSTVEIGKIGTYINLFIESDVASRLVVGIPFFIILILLSFFAYSLFIGILASVTTSMEDYQQIQTPVMIFLMLGYYLAIYASVYQGATFIKFTSFIPFISGIVAPVMYSLGQITIVGLIISIVLLIITCYLLYKYGLKIYKEGILNYQSSNLWKKMFKSLKN